MKKKKKLVGKLPLFLTDKVQRRMNGLHVFFFLAKAVCLWVVYTQAFSVHLIFALKM